MDNIVRLCDVKPEDPILRRGDLVRFYDMHSYADLDMTVPEDADEEDYFAWVADLEGQCGIVSSICMTLPLDHPSAPGQATYVDIAVPLEDGWEVIESISLHHVRRILGDDARAIRGYNGV